MVRAGDEVVTYVARNLEPYRGFPTYMRALEDLCRRRPNARFIIVGGDDVSYGQRLPKGETYRQKYLSEVTIDPARVHFIGQVPYDQFIRVLQISAAHIYLTYPFVLSWSMMESMATRLPAHRLGHATGARSAPGRQERTVRRLLLAASPSPTSGRGPEESPEKYKSLRATARQTVIERYQLPTA